MSYGGVLGEIFETASPSVIEADYGDISLQNDENNESKKSSEIENNNDSQNQNTNEKPQDREIKKHDENKSKNSQGDRNAQPFPANRERKRQNYEQRGPGPYEGEEYRRNYPPDNRRGYSRGEFDRKRSRYPPQENRRFDEKKGRNFEEKDRKNHWAGASQYPGNSWKQEPEKYRGGFHPGNSNAPSSQGGARNNYDAYWDRDAYENTVGQDRSPFFEGKRAPPQNKNHENPENNSYFDENNKNYEKRRNPPENAQTGHPSSVNSHHPDNYRGNSNSSQNPPRNKKRSEKTQNYDFKRPVFHRFREIKIKGKSKNENLSVIQKKLENFDILDDWHRLLLELDSNQVYDLIKQANSDAKGSFSPSGSSSYVNSPLNASPMDRYSPKPPKKKDFENMKAKNNTKIPPPAPKLQFYLISTTESQLNEFQNTKTFFTGPGSLEKTLSDAYNITDLMLLFYIPAGLIGCAKVTSSLSFSKNTRDFLSCSISNIAQKLIPFDSPFFGGALSPADCFSGKKLEYELGRDIALELGFHPSELESFFNPNQSHSTKRKRPSMDNFNSSPPPPEKRFRSDNYNPDYQNPSQRPDSRDDAPRTDRDSRNDARDSRNDPRDPIRNDARDSGRNEGREGGRNDPRDGGRPEPRDGGRNEPRDGGRNDPRNEPREGPRDSGRNDPREGGSNDPRDGGRPEPRDGGRNEPREGGRNQPREGGNRNQPREGGRNEPREGGRPEARDGGGRNDYREGGGRNEGGRNDSRDAAGRNDNRDGGRNRGSDPKNNRGRGGYNDQGGGRGGYNPRDKNGRPENIWKNKPFPPADLDRTDSILLNEIRQKSHQNQLNN